MLARGIFFPKWKYILFYVIAMMKLLSTLSESKIHVDNLNVQVYDQVSGAPALAHGSILKFIFNFLYDWAWFLLVQTHAYSVIWMRVQACMHTHSLTSRKHKQDFSKLSRQFSEWAAKVKSVSFFRVKDKGPSSASLLHEVNVDFIFKSVCSGSTSDSFDYVQLNP